MAATWWLVGPIVLGGILSAGQFYAMERDRSADRLGNRWAGPVRTLLFVGVFSLLWLWARLRWGEIVSSATAGWVTGWGLGLIGYRLLYGVVYPAPEAALDRVREPTT